MSDPLYVNIEIELNFNCDYFSLKITLPSGRQKQKIIKIFIRKQQSTIKGPRLYWCEIVFNSLAKYCVNVIVMSPHAISSLCTSILWLYWRYQLRTLFVCLYVMVVQPIRILIKDANFLHHLFESIESSSVPVQKYKPSI